MKSLKLPLSLFVVLVALYVAQALWFYPRLPPVVASHFSASGRPDGWMSKEANLVAVGLMLCPVIFIFVLIPLSNILPPSMFTMPNKEYWFAPERRAATIRWINCLLLWGGVTTLLLLLIVTRFAFLENLAPSGRLSFRRLGPILLLYVLILGVWGSLAMYRRFARKEQNGPDDRINQT